MAEPPNDSWKLCTFSLLSFVHGQTPGLELFIRVFVFLLLKTLQALGDVSRRKRWSRHAVEEIPHVLDGYPAGHRRFQQHLALSIPLPPNRVAPIYPLNDFLCQPHQRMRVADVAQGGAFHVVKEEFVYGPETFVFPQAGLQRWRHAIIERTWRTPGRAFVTPAAE
jgi:hypothetical protein